MATDPLHILKHEHRVIEQALRGLDGICLKLSWGEKVPPDQLSALFDFFSAYAGRYHHGKEEAHLLPALQQYGILKEESTVSVILHEHQVEGGLLAKLGSAIEEYANGNEEASKGVVEAAIRYVALLIGHIQKEDNVLFRIAEGVLDEEARETLTKAFREAERELGPGGPEKYEQAARDLEQTWAV